MRAAKRQKIELPVHDYGGSGRTDHPTPSSTTPFVTMRSLNDDDLVDENLDWNEVWKADPSPGTQRYQESCPPSGLAFKDLPSIEDFDWDDDLDQIFSHDHSSSSTVGKDEFSERPPFPATSTESASCQQPTTARAASGAPCTPPPQPDLSLPNALTGPNLHTCFRLRELQQQVSNGPHPVGDAMFQLYARVQHSHRETNNHIFSSGASFLQYFRFVDIKQDHAYVRGTLTGWRIGDVVDRQSAVFLDGGQDGTMRLCRLDHVEVGVITHITMLCAQLV
ncbi:hypothetical protein P8C59_008914 [Phyllachora maydis]|uniref:Uncharacterized protein n=1 Tax=Phyllachora maydis TaxID=1825666 RepID=A0AAD9MHK9_9PEZI|nr:hypothetical protein P8C59_008914 [Phyllachora maydis]